MNVWDRVMGGMTGRTWGALLLLGAAFLIAYGHVMDAMQGASTVYTRIGWLLAAGIILLSARPPDDAP